MAMLSSIQPAFPRWLRSAAANFVDATKLVLEHSSAWASIILALLTAGTLWVGAWYMADQDASRTQTAAFNDTENLARAFEENIIRLIQAYDQTLLFARSSYATSPGDFDLAKWAHEQHFVTDAALQIVIIGKSGVLADSTLGRPKTPMDLSDREHFRVHVNDAKDFLYISPPVFGRLSKKWSIQMSRRIYGPNGSFDGVILVSIDPLYLERFFESIDVAKKGMVLLSGLDGIVRARASADDRTIGQSILSGSLFAHLQYEESGSFVTTGERDGTVRFTSYRKVRGYPLVVAVGVARSAAFANIRYRRILYYSTALLVSLLIFVLTGMIVRWQIRLHRAAEKLWESANFDYLTKLPNRNKLNNEVSRLLAPAVGEQRQFALLLLDLDNFKLVNDTLGHEAGDVVLCAVANRLRDMARSSDFIARLGGDEFALLVNNAEAHNLGGLAQRILYELRRKMDYRGQSIEMCVSMGIAFFPNHGSTWADIFRAADLALYQAKKGGRNQSVVFEPRMRAEAEKRFDVLGSVRSAIEQHRIAPYYQPQICIESGEVVGFEALARIVEGDGKIRTPDEFLSALDDPAVARMFGHQMIQAACLDFAYGANNGIH